MVEDALWYEAAQVVGITNALNVVADALGAAGDGLDGDLVAAEPVFADIRQFYAREDVPVADTVLVLQALASRRGVAAELRASALLPDACRVAR